MKLLKENETSANLAAAKVMRISIIVLILNIAGIFIVDMTQMIIAYITGAVLLAVPTLFTNVMETLSTMVKDIREISEQLNALAK